ncbi:helix-turn-helix domain-containing protein [Nonomuraea typhae]|uniref:Helix-turn-helix domain-containing protein n=1 Tax=Nonomuraea typhae TaxID=2603600 RepID=A0ABW7Z9J9_9ACTN
MREFHRSVGTPRLLIVEGQASAPVCSDIYEDWVRAPVSKEDLHARIAALRARAEVFALPEIDPGGILRYHGSQVTLSPTETDLASELVAGFGCIVGRNELAECLPEGSQKSKRNALDLHIMRLRRRLGQAGLTIRNVWGRGYMLERL